MTTAPLTEQQLDEITAAVAAYQQHPSIGFACCSAHPVAEAGAMLLAEIRRQRTELAAAEMLAPQQCPAGLHADWLVDSEYAHACPWCQIESLRADAAAELLPVWEAVYEPGNVSDYLIGYMNGQDAATGAAEAWMRSQSEVTGRLEWVPWGDVTPMPDGYDRWFELAQQHDDGIDTDSGIVVRRRKEPTTAPLTASHSPAGDRDGETGAEGAAGRVGDSGATLADRLEAVLTERFTALGNPFSRMSINFQGPDGWPASKEVGPHDVAEVLRELLATPPRRTLTPHEYGAAWHAVEGAAGDEGADPGTVLHAVLNRLGIEWQDAARTPGSASRR